MFRRRFSLLCIALFFSTPPAAVHANNMQDLLRMSEQLDKADQNELRSLLQQADDCSRRWDFSCASGNLSKAQSYAQDNASRQMLAQSRQLLDSQRQAKREQEEREERQREAEERRAIERQRRLDAREAEIARAQSNASMAAHISQAIAGVRSYAAQSGAQVAQATANFERQRMELERDRERERLRVERERENRQRVERERPSAAAAPVRPTPPPTTVAMVDAPKPQIAPAPTPAATPATSSNTANGNALMREPKPDTNCLPGVHYAIPCDTRGSKPTEPAQRNIPVTGGIGSGSKPSGSGGSGGSGSSGSSGGSGSSGNSSGSGSGSGGGSGSGSGGSTGGGSGGGSGDSSKSDTKHGYIYEKVVAVGEWKGCEDSRERAREWAKRVLDGDATKECRGLGTGWNFSYEYYFLGYEQALTCKDGKWGYKFSGASAKCRKWQ